MGCTIDHLRADHAVRVLRPFQDHRGILHSPGETGVVLRLDLDWPRQEIVIEWLREGVAETMRFPLVNPDGPANGHMREFFELGNPVLPERPGRRFVPHHGCVPTAPPELPPVADTVVPGDARFEDAIRQVWALAGRHRFDEADAQLHALLEAPDARADILRRAAESVCELAAAHAFDPDPAVHQWLRRRGLDLWYAWGSGASAGGEGLVRAPFIRAAEERFAALDRARAKLSP